MSATKLCARCAPREPPDSEGHVAVITHAQLARSSAGPTSRALHAAVTRSASLGVSTDVTFVTHVVHVTCAACVACGRYEIGVSTDFRQCECPSFYPLPAASPGFETAYAAAANLPTHVHKTSCGGDWWQLGTYSEGAPRQLGNFTATAGWETSSHSARSTTGPVLCVQGQPLPDPRRRQPAH